MLVPAADAQTDLHYSCQTVIYIPNLLNKLVTGFSCTGPVGTAWGTVTRASTGETYYCTDLRGTMVAGNLRASGSGCNPF